MSGLSVKLPLNRDSIDGAYALNKDYFSMIKQNFKMLVLTNPGEIAMDPEFGVGLRLLLFEFFTPELETKINEKILRQISEYMPFLTINNIEYTQEDNSLLISIRYTIVPLSATDVLQLSNKTN